MLARFGLVRFTALAAIALAATGGWSGFAAAQTVPGVGGLEVTPQGPATSDPPSQQADLTLDAAIGARFTVGAGAAYAPDYFGAGQNSFAPAGVLRFDFVRLPGGFEFGSSGSVGFLEGFGPRGSVRYIPRRESSDHSEIDGLDNVDAALELGLGLGYEASFWRGYADLRYGVIGHNSWVGELGADAILRPNDAWVVNFGPRASWGAGEFMETYFGVTPREEIASDLSSFNASAGFYGVGVELGARYSFSENWGVEGKAAYERLVGDAADSPITEAGSANQFGLQVLLTRSLSLGF